MAIVGRPHGLRAGLATQVAGVGRDDLQMGGHAKRPREGKHFGEAVQSPPRDVSHVRLARLVRQV